MLCLVRLWALIRSSIGDALGATDTLVRGKMYKVITVPDTAGGDDISTVVSAQSDLANQAAFTLGAMFTMDSNVTIPAGDLQVIPVLAPSKTYEIVTVPAETADQTAIINNTNLTSTDQLVVGMSFTVNADASPIEPTGEFDAREIDANAITNRIESVQKKINTSRVQAGSQYAALESAVNYTTDLTAQYELAYNTVHDVNFSMETAHLAKNQILQQAATAMLAQANEGQQGLLQLIQ